MLNVPVHSWISMQQVSPPRVCGLSLSLCVCHSVNNVNNKSYIPHIFTRHCCFLWRVIASASQLSSCPLMDSFFSRDAIIFSLNRCTSAHQITCELFAPENHWLEKFYVSTWAREKERERERHFFTVPAHTIKQSDAVHSLSICHQLFLSSLLVCHL